MQEYVLFHTLLCANATLSSQARSVFANPGLAPNQDTVGARR